MSVKLACIHWIYSILCSSRCPAEVKVLLYDKSASSYTWARGSCKHVHRGERGVLWPRRYVVAFMALVGISTALLVNMLGQARIFTMAAREHLIPLFWAKVSQRYGTPIAAQITMGVASGQS